ncbi:MAG: hypothetical protein AAF598_21885, partial [Bacteroidota bacterium]
AVMDLQAQGIIVALTGLHGQPKDLFENIQLLPGLIPEKYSFDTFEDCTEWLEEYLNTAFAYLTEATA